MSEDRKAPLAFIGAGGFATSALYPNIHKVPQIDLVAVADLDEAKATRNARNFGAREVYTDAEKMLDEQQPDGVFVIGPAPMQCKVAPIVLKRGIPVYVEKPSANTSAEAKELAELAEANDTWGQCGFMKRFAYVYRMAKEIMQREEFGDLNMVTIHFGQGPYPQIWGIDLARRAMLIGQLCHIFDLTRFLGGDVASVQALYREVTPTQFAYREPHVQVRRDRPARPQRPEDEDRLPRHPRVGQAGGFRGAHRVRRDAVAEVAAAR